MRIRLDSNLRDVTRKYKRFSKQIPFTAAKTINALVIEAEVEERKQIDRDIDRPIPFTNRKGFMRRVKAATKRNPTNIQEMKTRQASYLRWQIYGGVQTAINAPGNHKRRIMVPTDQQPRDGYGNVRGPKYKNVVKSTINSPQLWQKNNTGIFKSRSRKANARYNQNRADQLRFTFEGAVRYKARYSFGAGYFRYVNTSGRFKKIFERELRKSLIPKS